MYKLLLCTRSVQSFSKSNTTLQHPFTYLRETGTRSDEGKMLSVDVDHMAGVGASLTHHYFLLNAELRGKQRRSDVCGITAEGAIGLAHGS